MNSLHDLKIPGYIFLLKRKQLTFTSLKQIIGKVDQLLTKKQYCINFLY